MTPRGWLGVTDQESTNHRHHRHKTMQARKVNTHTHLFTSKERWTTQCKLQNAHTRRSGGLERMKSKMTACASFFTFGGMSPFTWEIGREKKKKEIHRSHASEQTIFSFQCRHTQCIEMGFRRKKKTAVLRSGFQTLTKSFCYCCCRNVRYASGILRSLIDKQIREPQAKDRRKGPRKQTKVQTEIGKTQRKQNSQTILVSSVVSYDWNRSIS